MSYFVVVKGDPGLTFSPQDHATQLFPDKHVPFMMNCKNLVIL